MTTPMCRVKPRPRSIAEIAPKCGFWADCRPVMQQRRPEAAEGCVRELLVGCCVARRARTSVFASAACGPEEGWCRQRVTALLEADSDARLVGRSHGRNHLVLAVVGVKNTGRCSLATSLAFMGSGRCSNCKKHAKTGNHRKSGGGAGHRTQLPRGGKAQRPHRTSQGLRCERLRGCVGLFGSIAWKYLQFSTVH